ncbi:MAG: hypothetical protein HY093_03845 [Candidatus Liptonbacteria bacterium]|nr:hypothetical protein [Candidatus Liptonbacteria bacterium]
MKAEFFDGPTSLCYKDTLTLPAKTVRWEDRTLYYNPGKPNRYGHPSGWIHSTT